uniref:Uncharacterized protein n=1 Tax=Anopheles maculatus TaxID=74869 RepID=A0A182SKQ7_9DIPT
IYDCLDLGRRIDVTWPNEQFRSSGGRSSWKDWTPQEGMVGNVVHYWQPNHPDHHFRSNVNRTILLVKIGDRHVDELAASSTTPGQQHPLEAVVCGETVTPSVELSTSAVQPNQSEEQVSSSTPSCEPANQSVIEIAPSEGELDSAVEAESSSMVAKK